MLRLGVVTSAPAKSGSRAIPALAGLERHPLRGSLFDITCVLALRPPAERSGRASFDRETAALLHAAGADVVLLVGYLYVVTEPLLRAFPDRILNAHDGTAQYPGLHATRDAIIAGEIETVSIVHIVTPDLDRGPVLARSAPFPVALFAYGAVVAGEMDIVRAYAYAHREWMMRSAWSDLVVRALERLDELEEVAV